LKRGHWRALSALYKASASIQSREYALQINSTIMKRLESELFRNGDVFDLDGDDATGLQRGAWFRFSREMAFGEAFRDTGSFDQEPEALYFIDMPEEPPQCRLLMLGSLHHRISSMPIENRNRDQAPTRFGDGGRSAIPAAARLFR
jgi:hypothetical protein